MPKLWSFSTTLRSPDRIIDFLNVALEIDGQEWTNSIQEKYQILLIKSRKYKPEHGNLSEESIKILEDISIEMSYEQAEKIFYEKKYQDPAMRGRTSFSPLKDLGLAYINENNKVVVTDLAKKIIRKEIEFTDFFVKWSLKWQYPNPTSNDFVECYDIKPLIGVIALIDKVNNRWHELGHEPVGISKNEFSVFALSLININDINKQVDKLIEYRRNISQIEMRERNNYYKKYIEENLSEFSNATFKNIKDYTDNIIRYFSLTNLIRKRGNGYYIDLVPSRKTLIDSILKNEQGCSNNFETKKEYLDYLNDMNTPNIEISNEQLEIEYRSEIFALINDNNIYNDELEKLKIYSLKELTNLKKKILYKLDKKEYLNEQGISEIINNLEHIRTLDIPASLALEKWVTTSLITLNDAIEIKPNYTSDDENNILFTAPAGTPDIECYYEEFNSICEVTMLNGRDQWHNEGQPVMRHLKDFQEHSNNENNYCLFIAPQIHRDTLNTFWYSVKYEYEGSKLKIVPLSLKRFEEILYALRKLKKNNISFSRNNIKELFDTICNVDKISNSNEWWSYINDSFDDWKNKLINI